MIDILVVWVGTMAWLTSVLTIGFGVYLNERPDVSHMVDVVGGLASAFLWFIFAFGATSVQVPTGGVILSETSEGLALLGLGFGIFMVVVALIGTAFLMNVMDIVQERAAP